MLDQLGLGIRLDLTDNVSARADKILMKFDAIQRSAGNMLTTIQQVDSTQLRFEGLTIAGFAIMRIANEFNQFGRAVTGVFKEIQTQVIETSAEFEKYRLMMNTFYQSTQLAQEKLEWGVQFAAQTPFEVSDVIRGMTSMKAIGVDITRTFKDVNGEMKPFMEFIGNLGVIAPPEQGLKGLMIALRNLFGGNERSFQMRMDIKPSQILGRALSKDMDGLMEDIVELSNKLTPNMMGNLVGTWGHMTSNLEDIWTMFKFYLGESGVFQDATNTLKKFYNIFTESGKVQSIAERLAPAFQMLWKPVDVLADAVIALAEGFFKLSESAPFLSKLIIGLTAGAGAFALITGKMLGFFGTIIMGIAALGTFFVTYQYYMGGMTAFRATMEGIILGINTFIRGMFFATLGLVAFTYAWNKNLFGFKDAVNETLEGVRSDWSYTGELVASVLDGTNSEIKSLLWGLSDLQKAFLKIQAVWVMFYVLFKQDLGDRIGLTFGQKNLLESMGLLELTGWLAMLKKRVEEFWDGFASGILIVKDIFMTFYDAVLVPVKAILGGLVGIIDSFSKTITGSETGLLGIMQGQTFDLEGWRQAGKIAGTLLGTLIGFKAIKSITSFIVAPFTALTGALTRVNDIAGKAGGRIKRFFGPMTAPTQETHLDYLAGMTGSPDKRMKDRLELLGLTKEMQEDEFPIKRQSYAYSRWNPVKRLIQQKRVYGGLQSLKNMLDPSQQVNMPDGTPHYLKDEQYMDLFRGKYRDTNLESIKARHASFVAGDKRAANAPIYRDKRSLFGEALFGKRYSLYKNQKIGLDTEGDPIFAPVRETAWREGGLVNKLLRRPDYTYIGNTFGGEVADWFGDTRVGQYLGGARQRWGRDFQHDKRQFTDSRGGRLIAKAGRGIGKAGRRVGWLARGTGQVLGAGVRGLGTVGGVALRAIPALGALGAVGGGLYRAISGVSGGTGVEGFASGMDIISNRMKDMGGMKMFENLSSSAKKVWESISGFGKIAYEIWQKDGKEIMGKIWTGLKGGATLAWKWIQTNGATMFGNLVKWILTKALPTLFKGLLGIGVWLATSFFPYLITEVFPAGLKTLWTVFSEAISGAFNFALNAIRAVLPDWVKKIFGIDGTEANIKITTAGQTMNFGSGNLNSIKNADELHHGGLWMSPNEHTAIIRKDETVLPPLISKKLNTALNGGGFGGVSIASATIIVEAGKLSSEDARKQAQMIYDEFKRINRENQLRGQYA